MRIISAAGALGWVLSSLLLISPAVADEQMTPLASQGNWIAMSHSASITDPPDVCFAASVDGLALRTDNTDNDQICEPKMGLL
jgi:hypothetical protein